ncbi:hypothetical protein LJK88_46975 [Paenibacillus sp. P26]|nr:hypothetical protein LJK88_46975 [Paenibacillus sp. P26]UUZ91881.1 hypothetical protein LJK87_41360 [Paenibacillus sp. P25]
MLKGLQAVFSGALSDLFVAGTVFIVIALIASALMGSARLIPLADSRRPGREPAANES